MPDMRVRVAELPAALSAIPNDELLWRQVRDGDERAFEALYERHADTIYNYLFRRLADWSEAEDLTAVVFLEAYRRRGHAVVVDGKLLPWLYGIATNVLRNRRRTQWRNRRLLDRLAQERSEPVQNLADRVEAAERMRTLLEQTKELPRAQLDVLALCVWSGLTYEEAAAALGVPVGTVRSRLARARDALASSMEPTCLEQRPEGVVDP
jgi:RNA polymerase sigma-70 factor (ECF subfamily)